MSKDPSSAPDRSAGGKAPFIGGYRLLRLLGKGGLGEVFEATAPDGRHVALKTFLLRGDDQGLIAGAFVREASTGRRLEHPDIVRVLESGCHGDYAFLAMEYVPGHDLRTHTNPSSLLPVSTVMRAAARVASALDAAHRLHVIHRDIKPANVLVSWPEDLIKVADFGLARLGDAFRSRTGIIAGTPVYMSPEQLAEGPIGPATDLYSLGVLLFELLSGRLPHEGASMGELLVNVSTRPAPEVASLRPEVPAGLNRLVAQLLDKRAEARPSGAAEVTERLAAMLPGGANRAWDRSHGG